MSGLAGNVAIVHDVSGEASWSALVSAVNDRFGPVDVPANMAGILRGAGAGTPMSAGRQVRTGRR